jgi:hypothetical protein
LPGLLFHRNIKQTNNNNKKWLQHLSSSLETSGLLALVFRSFMVCAERL